MGIVSNPDVTDYMFGVTPYIVYLSVAVFGNKTLAPCQGQDAKFMGRISVVRSVDAFDSHGMAMTFPARETRSGPVRLHSF